jgi:hypothetical protein
LPFWFRVAFIPISSFSIRMDRFTLYLFYYL